MALRLEGQAYKILQVEMKAGGGQQGGTVKTRVRNLLTGRLWDHNFRPDERLEDLELEQQKMDFLYSDASNAVFMNPVTFEQTEIPLATLGGGSKFLKEGISLPVEFFEGRPVSVALPDSVEMRVADTADPVHAQQDSTWKEATLDNGVQIKIPLFIGPGELIRVDVETGRYLERIRERKKTA
jgi:elongation factor P